MKKTYTIPTCRKEHIDKAIKRFEKKASAYGKVFATSEGEPYAKMRRIMAKDPVTNTLCKVGQELVEVYDLTIDSETIKKDGYSVVAKLEHLEAGNFVYNFTDEMNTEWHTKASCCEHCGTKHFRKVTFIVRKEDGTEKQVGRTCLKDYCGISPSVFASMNELTDLILENDYDHCDYTEAKPQKVYEITEVLALAIRVNKQQGYVKSGEPGSNKEKLTSMLIESEKPTDKEISEAQDILRTIHEMAPGIRELYSSCDTSEQYRKQCNWCNRKAHGLIENMWALEKNGYCKTNHLGYVAYAPIAYSNYIIAKAEQEEKEREKKKSAKASEWVGKVGERVKFEIASANLLTSFENDYGRTYLYKFTDNFGNILIWFASKFINGECKQLIATIKDHSERDGIKQTVLTRCKVA